MDIEKKLQEYDEAFDFYLDQGRMPDTLHPEDPLAGFMKQTFAANPQLDSQDPLWTEILKDEMMKFLEAMLKLYQPIIQAYHQEKRRIRLFAEGNLAQKRKDWKETYLHILSNYSTDQVNVNGYLEQMKSQDVELVMLSLTKDWNKACEENYRKTLQEVIEHHRQNWETHLWNHGTDDYKERRKVEKAFYSNPQLVEIVRIIGREQPQRKDELDDTVKRYLPILPSPPRPVTEIEEVALGNDLQHLLPVETALMSDKQTEDLFCLKYASRKLQLFSNKPKNESVTKIEQRKIPKPRMEKGPIIVSVDTSGSMHGRPEQLAKCLLMQLLRMARKQKRRCFLIEFSVRAKCLDLSTPNAWSKLNAFLDEHFTGGTDGEEMLDAALKMLYTAKYAMADVLVISDFEFDLPRPSTLERMRMEHEKGTRFYGLQIGSYRNPYNETLDRIWKA